MHTFFRSNGFRAVLAVFVLLLCLSIYTAGSGDSLLVSTFRLVSTPMQRVAAQTTALLRHGETHTEEEYAALLEENRQLREQLTEYYELKEKNAQYESILNLHEAHEDYQMVSAAVISRDPNDVFYSFVIDKGSRAGIHENDCVITSDGLVGLVTGVYANAAQVSTVFSPDVKISAVSREWRESGITECNLQLADKNLLRLSYLTRDTQLAQNTIITTSGISGTYPADLLIGRVEALYYSQTDASVYAVLTPYADIAHVRDVFVITDFAGKGQVAEDFGFPEKGVTP